MSSHVGSVQSGERPKTVAALAESGAPATGTPGVEGGGGRPKVSISVMRAALAAAGVPTAGLLERAEFEALYWRLQEGEAPPETLGAGAAAAVSPGAVDAAPRGARETVLGNCTRCGSADRLKFCSRCQAVRYCGPDCQRADVSRRFFGGLC